MESIDAILSESKEMLKKFHDDCDKNRKTNEVHTQYELRTHVASFIVNQMQSIKRQDDVRSIVEAEMLRKIALHEASINELDRFYATISKEKSLNTDVLLKLFAPTPQTTSPIITPAKSDDTTEELELTSEERNALNKLTLVMKKLEENKKNTIKDE